MKDTYNFAPRHMIFKLQQDAFKFNHTCVSWSSPKTGLETNFLKLENRECQFFCHRNCLSKYSTFFLINLLISLKEHCQV